MRSDRESGRKKQLKYDRAIAAAVWVVSGLFAGLAFGIFTGHGWLCLGIGFVLGLVLAVWLTKPDLAIEEE